MAGRYMPLDKPLRVGATIALMTAGSLLGPNLVHAGAPGYEIQLGVAESDNIQRLPSGARDETIGYEELGFTWHEKRPSLDADIDADISHLSYLQHTYDDEVIGNFIGQARVNLVPQLLTWETFDNFGQNRLNPLSPITPGNRENVNYFGTGPELSLPLGRETRLDLTGQYGRVDYQKSPLNSTRLTGGVGLVHELSPLSSISLNVREDRINFANDQLNHDYDRQEAFARFDTNGSRTKIGFDLGYSRLDLLGAHQGSVLARLDVSRRVSASSTVGLAIGHDYSDGADAFRLVQSLGGATLNTQSTVQSGAPLISNYATLLWNFQHVRTTLSLSASYFHDRYQTAPGFDNDRDVLNATLARQITPSLQLALTEYALRQQFISADVSATETNTGLQLNWHAGRSLTVLAAYYLAKSSSDIPASVYTENRVWIGIGYGRAAEVPPGPAPLKLPGRY